jgi:hypothetical protein
MTKEYTPEEVATKVLVKTKELLKNKQEELAKNCGPTESVTKSDKLKEFIAKRKAKKAAPVEKILGVGAVASEQEIKV